MKQQTKNYEENGLFVFYKVGGSSFETNQFLSALTRMSKQNVRALAKARGKQNKRLLYDLKGLKELVRLYEKAEAEYKGYNRHYAQTTREVVYKRLKEFIKMEENNV